MSFGKLDSVYSSSAAGQSERPPSFFSSLLGLILTPEATVGALVKNSRSPYVLTFFLTLGITIFVPIASQIIKHDFLATQLEAVLALALTLIFTGLVFIALEWCFLRLLRLDIPARRIFQLQAYGCAPLILIVMLFYVINFVMFGRLSIVTFIITGVENARDPTMEMFPWAQIFAHFLFLRVFYFGFRALSPAEPNFALFLTISSAIPFYIGFFVVLTLVGALIPGSTTGMLELANSIVQLVAP